MSIKCCTKKS